MTTWSKSTNDDMKTLIAAFALLLGGSAAAQHDASYGTHGMALFGGKSGLYVSHLPMFHAPHDTQMVARVHLEDRQLDAALRAQLDGKTALWTVNPEKFELNRLAPGAPQALKAFKADIVAGHFERGGETRHAAARVVVDEVLIYRKLSPDTRGSASSVYRPVGPFLVKEIDSRPDFDHIVLLRKMVRTPVTVKKTGLVQPALPNAVGTIYFDTADLK
jgi:hypothetical protein